MVSGLISDKFRFDARKKRRGPPVTIVAIETVIETSEEPRNHHRRCGQEDWVDRKLD